MQAHVRLAFIGAAAALAVAAGLVLAGRSSAPAEEGGAAPKKDEGSQAKPAALPDGKYAAASRGHAGDVKVEVTVKDGKMTEVKVADHEEDEPQTAMEDVPAAIVKQQSAKVDAVTGATQSSRAVMRAAAEALASARPLDLGKLPDGDYAGASRGHVEDVAVKVTVKSGKIAAVAVTGQKESQPGAALKAVPARIVEKQSAAVDAVTGATVTSRAVMRAAAEALASARDKPAAAEEKKPPEKKP